MVLPCIRGWRILKPMLIRNPDNKDLFQSLAITAGFNTFIAVVVFALAEHAGFRDVFVISQFIGLSICAVINASLRLAGRGKKHPGPFGVSDILVVCAGLFLGIVLGALLSWAYIALVHADMETSYILTTIFGEIFLFGVVFGVPIIYFFFSREKIMESERQIREEKIRRLTLEKEAAMMGLKLLQAQIEPHFLFNTLSNITSLMDVDPAKARKMLIHLNAYLRISLERTRKQMITLDRELDLVRHYLDIFKIRMGKRLDYTIRFSGEDNGTGLGAVAFPPLILQPLVENAVKYGLEPKVEGGCIDICIRTGDSGLLVSVSDNGMGLGQDQNLSGIGLDNISRRLDALYGDGAGLSLKENRTGGMTAEVRIPL